MSISSDENINYISVFFRKLLCIKSAKIHGRSIAFK